MTRFFKDKLKRLSVVLQVIGLIVLRLIRVALWTRFVDRNLYLKSWFYELGNNLIQLTHAEYLSQKSNLLMYLPQHPLLTIEEHYSTHALQLNKVTAASSFTASTFLLDLKTSFAAPPIPDRAIFRSFFYRYDLFPLLPQLVDYRNILNQRVLPLIPSKADPSISPETLVIHIRSGDIFGDGWIHSGYVQPPLSFYLTIIERFAYRDIVIVTQPDLRNPCIHQLKQLFPDIRIQAKSLLEDVSTILSARHLVTGMSSFSLTLGFASSNINRLYVPQFEVIPTYWRTFFWSRLLRLFIDTYLSSSYHCLDFELYQLKISQYIRIGSWGNTLEQRELMLNHLRSNVSFNS